MNVTGNKTIALINGSMNKNSFTRKLLLEIETRIKSRGYHTEFIDVRTLNAPVYDPDIEPPKSVRQASEKLIAADGVVVGSPEYHGSFSGSLKNLLDFFGASEFKQTPIALATTTGGMKSGTNTMNHLRIVFRNLHGIVIPPQFAISQKETTPNLELDENTSLRLDTIIQSLIDEVKKKALLEAYEEDILTDDA
ncbi:NADPH-dependent FMN reductase [Evansella halocellulosilytica]|uniref:NADPH-dependent FMN reductase n=1 Tax=Evansella halocellulosilytica TaxID=2011013 RepID=UPI000BB80B55|nr:NAD(P)H-dependent oxidoreductase [Evansella halocellulosilytica]